VNNQVNAFYSQIKILTIILIFFGILESLCINVSWNKTRVGSERIKGVYAWLFCPDKDVHLTLTSSFLVESLNSFCGIYTAGEQTPVNGQLKYENIKNFVYS
jgi:predicted amidohydrolase YtcJ